MAASGGTGGGSTKRARPAPAETAPTGAGSVGGPKVTRAPGASRRDLGLTLRVDLGPEAALGPGKVRLLEGIAATGSITAAGRAMGMSYRRAWLLVDAVNRTFGAPVVATRQGGRAGGGAGLTGLGEEIVRRYRRIEAKAASATAAELAALGRLVDAAGDDAAGSAAGGVSEGDPLG